MGKCEYVLSKDSMHNWFEIREVNEACNGGKVTCTKSISVIFPVMAIYLKRGSVMVNGSTVTLPYSRGGKITVYVFYLRICLNLNVNDCLNFNCPCFSFNF